MKASEEERLTQSAQSAEAQRNQRQRRPPKKQAGGRYKVKINATQGDGEPPASGVPCTQDDCRLAHAGYYYGDVVGLFGCAGPLFGGGY